MFPLTADVFDPIAWWARVDGQRTALIEAATERRHSYASLHADADLWAARLVSWGVQPGDRVAIVAPNRVEFIALLFGCIRRGAVLVPLNWRLAAPELALVLADAAPTIVLGVDRYRGLAEDAVAVAGVAPAPRWIDMDRDLRTRLHSNATSSPHAPRSDDATMLLYTSGSTGQPKGVIVPHRQLLWNAVATNTSWALSAQDAGPAATPFFHTGGWNVFTTPLLLCGGTVVLIDSFDADSYFDMLERFRITITFGVPTQLDMVRNTASWGRALPALRTFISGGAPCPTRIKQDVRDAGYRFREGYGLTECGPNCFATNDTTAVEKSGTVGWPIAFLEARLRDGDCHDVGADAIGELELRGPQLFGGYFRAPDKTAEVMTADGWLRTGDLASRDIDGVYTIRGRRKEMFISGGENVFPGEVETALLGCVGVREVVVIGVPDARWGEVGCALIVKADPTLDAERVLREARERLAGYKVPKRIQFVTEIPRLGSGKIDRRSAQSLIDPPAVIG